MGKLISRCIMDDNILQLSKARPECASLIGIRIIQVTKIGKYEQNLIHNLLFEK